MSSEKERTPLNNSGPRIMQMVAFKAAASAHHL